MRFTDKMNSKGESNPSDSELGVRNPAFTDEVDGTLTKRRNIFGFLNKRK